MQWPRTKYPGLGPALKQVSGIILFPLKGFGSVLKMLLEQEPWFSVLCNGNHSMLWGFGIWLCACISK